MKYAFQNSSVKSARRPRRVRNRNAARYARVERPVKYAGINGISGVSAPSASSSDGVKGIDGIQGGGDRQGKSKRPSVFYNGREWTWSPKYQDYVIGFHTNGHSVVLKLKEEQEKDRARRDAEANRQDDETWGFDDNEKPIKDAPDENDRKICSTVGNNLNLGWSRAFDLIAEAKENGDEERAKYLVGIVVKNAADIHRRGFLVHGAQDALTMINGELKEGGLASMREHLKNVALKLADAKPEELRDLSEQLFQRYVDAGGDQSRLSQEERKRVRKPAEEKRVDDEDYIPDVGDESAPESQNKENIVDDTDEEEEEEEEDEDEPPLDDEEDEEEEEEEVEDEDYIPDLGDEPQTPGEPQNEDESQTQEQQEPQAEREPALEPQTEQAAPGPDDSRRTRPAEGGEVAAEDEETRDFVWTLWNDKPQEQLNALESARDVAWDFRKRYGDQVVGSRAYDLAASSAHCHARLRQLKDAIKSSAMGGKYYDALVDALVNARKSAKELVDAIDSAPYSVVGNRDYSSEKEVLQDFLDKFDAHAYAVAHKDGAFPDVYAENDEETALQEIGNDVQNAGGEKESGAEETTPEEVASEETSDDGFKGETRDESTIQSSGYDPRNVSEEQRDVISKAVDWANVLANGARRSIPKVKGAPPILRALRDGLDSAWYIPDFVKRASNQKEIDEYVAEFSREIADARERARQYLEMSENAVVSEDSNVEHFEKGKSALRGFLDAFPDVGETTEAPAETASREIDAEVNPSEHDAEEYAPSVANDVDDEVTEEDLDEIRRNYDKLVDAFDSSRESVAHWVGVCKRRDATGEFDESSLWSTEASVWRACLKDAHGDQELAFVNFRELAIQNVKRLRETKAELAYYLLSSLRQVPDEWKDKYGNSVALDKENGAFVVEGEMAKDVAAYHRNTGGEGQVKRVRKGKYIIPYTYYSFQKAFCVVEPENLDELFESAREQLFNEREDDEEFVPDVESETTEVEASDDGAPEGGGEEETSVEIAPEPDASEETSAEAVESEDATQEIGEEVAPEESAPEPSEAASREIVSKVNPPGPDPDAASGDEADAQSVQNESPSAEETAPREEEASRAPSVANEGGEAPDAERLAKFERARSATISDETKRAMRKGDKISPEQLKEYIDYAEDVCPAHIDGNILANYRKNGDKNQFRLDSCLPLSLHLLSDASGDAPIELNVNGVENAVVIDKQSGKMYLKGDIGKSFLHHYDPSTQASIKKRYIGYDRKRGYCFSFDEITSNQMLMNCRARMERFPELVGEAFRHYGADVPSNGVFDGIESDHGRFWYAVDRLESERDAKKTTEPETEAPREYVDPSANPRYFSSEDVGTKTLKSEAFGVDIQEEWTTKDGEDFIYPKVSAFKKLTESRKKKLRDFAQNDMETTPAEDVVDACLALVGGVSRKSAATPGEMRFRLAEMSELHATLYKEGEKAEKKGDDEWKQTCDKLREVLRNEAFKVKERFVVEFNQEPRNDVGGRKTGKDGALYFSLLSDDSVAAIQESIAKRKARKEEARIDSERFHPGDGLDDDWYNAIGERIDENHDSLDEKYGGMGGYDKAREEFIEKTQRDAVERVRNGESFQDVFNDVKSAYEGSDFQPTSDDMDDLTSAMRREFAQKIADEAKDARGKKTYAELVKKVADEYGFKDSFARDVVDDAQEIAEESAYEAQLDEQTADVTNDSDVDFETAAKSEEDGSQIIQKSVGTLDKLYNDLLNGNTKKYGGGRTEYGSKFKALKSFMESSRTAEDARKAIDEFRKASKIVAREPMPYGAQRLIEKAEKELYFLGKGSGEDELGRGLRAIKEITVAERENKPQAFGHGSVTEITVEGLEDFLNDALRVEKDEAIEIFDDTKQWLKKNLSAIEQANPELADAVRKIINPSASGETGSEADAQYLGDLFQHEGGGSNVDPNAPIPEIKSRFDYKIGNIDSDEIDMGDWSVKIDPASRSVKVETRGDLAADDEFREMLEQQAEFQPADTEYGFNSQGTRDAYSFYLTPDLIENFKQSGVLPRDYEPQRKPTSDDEFFAKKTGDEKLDAAKASFVEFARLRNPTYAEIDAARGNVMKAFQAFAPDDDDSPELARRKREAFMRGIAFAVKNYLGEKEGKYVDQRLASVEEKEGDDAQYDKSVFNVSRELIRKLDRDAQKLILGGKSFADFFPDATRARKRTEPDPETAPRDSREIASAPVSDDDYKPLASGAGVSRAASIYDDEPANETSEPDANAAEGDEADAQALGEQTEERGFVGDRGKRWNDVLEMRLSESVNSLRMSDAFQREAADSVKKIDALLEKGRRSEAAAEGASLTKTAVRWYGRLKESGVADTHADETFLRLLGASTVPNDERDASPVSFDRALRAMARVEPNGARYALIFNDAIDRASDSQGEDFGFAKKEIPEKGFEKVFFDLSSDLPSQVEKEIRDRVVDGAFRDAVSNAIRQTNHGCDETDALREISKDNHLLKWAYQYCSSGYGQNPSSEKERKSLAKKIEKRLGKMLVDEYGVAERGEAASEPVDNAPQTPEVPTPEASAQSVAPEESAPSATLDEQIDSASDDEIASGVSNAPVSKTEEAVADVGNVAQDEEETEPPRSPVVSEDKKKGVVTYKSDAFGANIKERKVKRDEREYLVPVVKLKSFNLDREREFVRYVERLEDNAPASEVVDKCLEILGGVSRAGANTPEEWRYRYAELEELRRVLTKTLKDPMHQGEEMMEALSRIDSLDGRFWTDDFSNLFERVESEEDLIGIINSRIGYEPRRAKDSGVSGDGIGPNATAFDKAYKWDYESWWKEEQEDRKRQKQAEKSPTPAESASEPSEAASREIVAEVNPPEPDPDAASGDEADAQSVAEETEEREDEYKEPDDIKRAKAREKEIDSVADRFFSTPSKDSQFDADKRELKKLLDARLEAIEKEQEAFAHRRYCEDSEQKQYYDAEYKAALNERKEASVKAKKIIAKYGPANTESEQGASEMTSQRDLMFLIGSSYLRQTDSRNLPYIRHDIHLFEEGTKKYSPDDFRYTALFNRALQKYYWDVAPRFTIETAREAVKKFKAPSFKGFVDELKDEKSDYGAGVLNLRFSKLVEAIHGGNLYGEDYSNRQRQAIDVILGSKELTQLAYQYAVAKDKEENARAAFNGALHRYSDCKKEATKIVSPLKSETTRRFNKFANALREAMRQETPQQPEDEDGA